MQVALADCEVTFQEPNKRMRDAAALPRAVPRSRTRGLAAPHGRRLSHQHLHRRRFRPRRFQDRPETFVRPIVSHRIALPAPGALLGFFEVAVWKTPPGGRARCAFRYRPNRTTYDANREPKVLGHFGGGVLRATASLLADAIPPRSPVVP
jgi:hypothetical protein